MPTPQAIYRPTRAAARALQWLVVWLLAVCLPLQAASAAVTAMLGARHTHRSPVAVQVVANDPQDPMAGWQDFRRMQHGGVDRHSLSLSQSHAHAHEAGLRHHHDVGDDSVVAEDASGVDRGLSSDPAQASASFLFMTTSGAADVPPPREARAVLWGRAGAVAPGNPDPRRIERPPQALSAS